MTVILDINSRKGDNMNRILVIEDELSISKMICMNLTISGYQTVAVQNGSDAADLIRADKEFDLALVDVMMPGISGFELLPLLQEQNIPAIMLTAKSDIESKLLGLTGGAEDYIVKPFEMPELLARIDNVIKRNGRGKAVINIGDVEINTKERTVRKDNRPLSFTPIEFDLLLLLVRNRNVALSREKILSDVWNINYEGGTRTVDVHIAQIRKKTKLCIVSVPKIGYRLEA